MENETNKTSISAEPTIPHKRVKIVFSVLTLLVVVLAAGAVYFYMQTKVDSGQKALEANKKTLEETIEAVGKLILLPTDEEPTLATVSDPVKLQNQEFFKNAEKDDRVLIYSKARKAILYSPTKHKVIEVAPINLTAPQTEGTVPTGTQ